MRFARRLGLLFLLAAGCNRSDADALGRIGELLWKKSKALPQAGPHGKLVQALVPSADGELARRVDEQLRGEPAFAHLSIRVESTEGRVRLTGRVAGDDERARVLQLAETTAGAGKVVDALEANR